MTEGLHDIALNVLIVEDETAATVNMLSIIARVCPSATVAATLETVDETVEWLASHDSPDVIFMDIHLADGSAFRIFEAAKVAAPVIFTTAYDRYALDAFRVNSIDYLLKPIKAEDLRRSLDKLAHLSELGAKLYFDRVAMVAVRENNPEALFLLRYRDKLVPLRGDDIAFAYSTGEAVTVFTADGRRIPYDKSLGTFAEALPEHRFFRANRQFVISRDAITEISVWFGGRLKIELSQPAPEIIVVSKARTPVFKAWLKGGK